jgi:hypothetical protein
MFTILELCQIKFIVAVKFVILDVLEFCECNHSGIIIVHIMATCPKLGES